MQAERRYAETYKFNFLNTVKDIAYIISVILICGFALKSFLVPNQFFDGGVTGISLLIHELYHVNIAYVIVTANLPFIVMGIYQVNVKFAWKTLTAIIGVGLCLHFIPYPVITSDKLLVCIFGGVFMGTGVGLAIRGGCALDGIEVLALYTLKRSSFTISEIILGINVLIFSIAAIIAVGGLVLPVPVGADKPSWYAQGYNHQSFHHFPGKFSGAAEEPVSYRDHMMGI